MSVLPKEPPTLGLTAGRPPSRYKTRKFAILGALTTAAAFFLFGPASLPQCADTSPISTTAPRHNVWKNFDVEEATAIREWLWAYKDSTGLGFNLTTGIAATDFDNSIALIENFPPPKADVLGYFDRDGTSPQRFAKYLLGPLPKVISKQSVRQASVELKPLRFDLLGGVVRSGPFGDVDLEPHLLFAASTPFSYDGSFRRLWIQLKKNVPGSFLMALDMYFYVDLTSMDPSEWYLVRMVYNRQVFDTTEDFLEAYSNGTLKRSSPPDIPGSDEEAWAARGRRGNKRDLDERAGPRQVSFNGARYRVDKDNQWVTWMGWSFYLSFARDMGMSLWDVRFREERILYEISPQEALAVYSGSDPHQGSTVFLDGGFGMGTATRALIVGYDCPYDSLLLPGITHTSVGTLLQQDAICVFERDSGKPLSRHTGYMKGEMGAIKGYELVVRTISTVGNYDYLFDYTFQLDGTLEVRISASGYLQGAWWDDAEMPYGTKIRDTYSKNYKFDFDIAGTRNSLMAVSLENEVVEQPWFDDDWGSDVHQQKIRRPAGLSKNYEGVYAIINEEELNPRGYAIHPGISPIHLTNLDSKRTRNNVNFAKHHLAVSRRKDSEPSSSSMWNINLPGAPQSLEQEDLTAWVNLGMHHIPRAEDSPMTLTNIATSSVLLTPFNFNDWDPAMESMNAIIIDVPSPAKLGPGTKMASRASTASRLGWASLRGLH
ncbi:copper amine oxidase [Mycena haematopus]|nr:copper amine oxidase [Mycena haematopus]